jgi:hypothetical protein
MVGTRWQQPTLLSIATQDPFYEGLSVGQVPDTAPSVTSSGGHATTRQRAASRQLPLALSPDMAINGA